MTLLEYTDCKRVRYGAITVDFPLGMDPAKLAIALGEIAHTFQANVLNGAADLDSMLVRTTFPAGVPDRRKFPLREVKKRNPSKKRGRPQTELLECGHRFTVPSGHEKDSQWRRCPDCHLKDQ